MVVLVARISSTDSAGSGFSSCGSVEVVVVVAVVVMVMVVIA